MTPTAIYVNWVEVGYYNSQTNLTNSFQLVLTDGNDPGDGIGNNVAISYLDMQWTTGQPPAVWAASGKPCRGGVPTWAAPASSLGQFDQPGMPTTAPSAPTMAWTGWTSKDFVFSTVNRMPMFLRSSGNDHLITRRPVRRAVGDPGDRVHPRTQPDHHGIHQQRHLQQLHHHLQRARANGTDVGERDPDGGGRRFSSAGIDRHGRRDTCRDHHLDRGAERASSRCGDPRTPQQLDVCKTSASGGPVHPVPGEPAGRRLLVRPQRERPQRCPRSSSHPDGSYSYSVGNGSLCPSFGSVDVSIFDRPDAGQNGTGTYCSVDPTVDLFTLLGALLTQEAAGRTRAAVRTAGSWTPPWCSPGITRSSPLRPAWIRPPRSRCGEHPWTPASTLRYPPVPRTTQRTCSTRSEACRHGGTWTDPSGSRHPACSTRSWTPSGA